MIVNARKSFIDKKTLTAVNIELNLSNQALVLSCGYHIFIVISMRYIILYPGQHTRICKSVKYLALHF